MSVKRLVIWAHSECRSNAALLASVSTLAEERGIAVTTCLWDMMPMEESRKLHAFEPIRVGDDLQRGRDVVRRHGGPGTVHVFCVYQNSAVWRQLIVEAKKTGARVVVNAEAPCEMCLGVKAWLKRAYYRWMLPWRVRAAVKAADLFVSSSGEMGKDRLLRLGWTEEKIVPFGYASPRLNVEVEKVSSFRFQAGGFKFQVSGRREQVEKLRVLHLGSEAAYRGVEIAEKAARIAGVELVKTGGKMPEEELVAEIRRADVVVGCGLCEPWGMRINDVLLEGVPVVVSDGMGVSWAVERYGCGCVVPKGDVRALAGVLERCKSDAEFLSRLRSGAQVAARELLPENRAREWLRLVVSG